jgi:hypothetical protein
MVAGLGDTVAETVEKTYGNRKTIEVDELLGGHTIEQLVGKSDGWLRRRRPSDGDLEFAPACRNVEAANRTVEIRQRVPGGDRGVAEERRAQVRERYFNGRANRQGVGQGERRRAERQLSPDAPRVGGDHQRPCAPGLARSYFIPDHADGRVQVLKEAPHRPAFFRPTHSSPPIPQTDVEGGPRKR